MADIFEIIKKDIEALSQKAENGKIKHIIRKLNEETVEKIWKK
ncbi:MAG: hypothetical protein U9O53_01955 [archaeon]|nr:hypothetical protein [archaeon]